MILLIDIGNSRLKWLLCKLDSSKMGLLSRDTAIIQRGDFIHASRLPESPPSDTAAVALTMWGHLPRPLQAVIASVASESFTAELIYWMRQHWGCSVYQVRPQASGFRVRNAYHDPHQMGVDRWIGLVAARARVSTACCIIDCGTAVTIDALHADGHHLGGVIFPGPTLMRQSLYEHTRRIPPSTTGQVTLFGHCTRDGVWGGTVYAVTSAINGITQKMTAHLIGESLTNEVHYFLTGGDAQYLHPYLTNAPLKSEATHAAQMVYQQVPDLIFEGLSIIAAHQEMS